MRVSAAGNKPWKRAAMKTIPKLCLSVFFPLFISPLYLLMAARWPPLRPSGRLGARLAVDSQAFLLRGISVKKHGGRL